MTTPIHNSLFVLYNSSGQIIYSEQLYKNENTIQLNIATGIYYYNIIQDLVIIKNGKMMVE